jgi:hypothetical protein
MGREALCLCRVGDTVAQAKALFETQEIILRGDLRRRFPLSAITDVRVDGDDLQFTADRTDVALTLGASQAAKWAAVLEKGPPSLTEKLGLEAGVSAWVIGAIDGPALELALRDHRTPAPNASAMTVAMVDGAEALERVIETHRAHCAGRPLWIVYAKGRTAAFGEAAVRSQMRAAGFIDTKVSAVSPARSATRFSNRSVS